MRWLGPKEFEELLSVEPIILDCQPNVHDYIHEHIAGAVYVNEESFRLSHRGAPHAWLPRQIATSVLRQLGVCNDSAVAIYGSRGASNGDGMAQMVLAYSLARYGHNNIAVLDGGLDRWKEESMPLTKVPTRRQAGDFRVSIRRGFCASTSNVERATNEEGSLIIDNRAPDLYQGQSEFMKAGHIPGAINLPWTELITSSNPCRIMPIAHLRNLLERVGALDRNVILYCATGRKSAALFCIMRFLLHHESVRLYEGSFTEWCADPRRKTILGLNP